MKRPTEPVVYRVYDEWDRLIYVGATGQVHQRLATHRSQSWWSGLTARVEIEQFDTLDEALAAEACAIHAEDPAYNVLRAEGLRYFPVTDYEVQVCKDWLVGSKSGLGYIPTCLHRFVAPGLHTWPRRPFPNPRGNRVTASSAP